jgi:hypothetical protein
MQCDTPKARPVIRISSRCGKDADPDILNLKQAKTEYAKLQWSSGESRKRSLIDWDCSN